MKIMHIGIFHMMVLARSVIGCNNFFIKEGSGSGCDGNLMKIDLVYQTLEIDTTNGYLKCSVRSNLIADQEIHADIYESDKQINSYAIHKNQILYLPFKYLTSKHSYISLYYANRKNILCPQEYVHYSVYHLIQGDDIPVLHVMEWLPACFEFPKKTAEVVWPIDLDFKEYCICAQDKLQRKNGCQCPKSKLFDVEINDDGKVCFNATMQDDIQVAIYFRETKINGCGNDCDLIILLRGHRIDTSQISKFSFRYNEFRINDTYANFAWFGIQCGKQTQYEVVEAGARNSRQMVGYNTFISVGKHSVPSKYYVRALRQDNSSCSISAFSLQVSIAVTTQYIVLNATDYSACISPSTISSSIIMPQNTNNNSCICSKLENLKQCSCIDTVQFDVLYNTSADNQLCFYNIRTNNTCIMLISQAFNSPNFISEGFPSFNQEILNSFCFVIANTSQTSLFSFQYDKFIINSTVFFIAWNEIQCGQRTQYEVVEVGAINSCQMVGLNTFTSIQKHSPLSRYYVRALNQDNSSFSKSAFSLQVPTGVTTQYIVVNATNYSACISPSTISSRIIMPQKKSNDSCTCSKLKQINQCSCINNVQFDVFYNTSNNSLCFYNVTTNNTCILFISQTFNSPNYVSEGFPSYNQEILESFCFVIAGHPLPPTIISYLNKNQSICLIDTFDGFSNITSYSLRIKDNTGFTINVSYNKSKSKCYKLPYNKYCGSLSVTIWSINEIGLSSPKTDIIESGDIGQICDCFNQNVKITLNTSETVELICNTRYVNFNSTARLQLIFEPNSGVTDTFYPNCSTSTKIPSAIPKITASVNWITKSGKICPVLSQVIDKTDDTSIPTGEIVGGVVSGILVLILICTCIGIIIYLVREKKRSGFVVVR